MSFIEEVLQTTNRYRKRHGCPPLQLNNEISEYSKKCAENLYKAEKFVHSAEEEKYGENVYYFSCADKNTKISGDMPVRQWYEEIKYYSFEKEPEDLKAGHFTQLIWKDCKEIGIGMAGGNGKYIVVCNYHPPGNEPGKYQENIPNIVPITCDHQKDQKKNRSRYLSFCRTICCI